MSFPVGGLVVLTRYWSWWRYDSHWSYKKQEDAMSYDAMVLMPKAVVGTISTMVYVLTRKFRL